MTASIAQARAALATALTFDGVQTNPEPPGTINVPALVISQSEGEFLTDVTLDGETDLHFTVTAFAGRGQDASSNAILDAFAADTGATSITAAVDADPTLGGVVSSALVVSIGSFGSFAFAGGEYLGCAFAVEIFL